jgi:transposase InsO family protein
MFERAAFVRAYEAQEDSLSALCRRFGVSRKTAYKWLQRVESEGEAGLLERSRAPHTHPNAIDAQWEERIRKLRQGNTWGPKKVQARLREAGNEGVPSVSTVANVLNRQGLVVPRVRKHRATPTTAPLAHATECNRVWCIDFKGWFRTQDGARIDPLTVTDACTRYLLCCQATPGCRDGAYVQARLEAAFRTYGLPERIRSDNGAPFASTGLGGLSALSVWWIRLGIVPERIAPGHPEQNGRHERFHLTLAQDTATPPAGTAGAQQRRFDAFQRTYNDERPHEALGQVPPGRLYVPSPRPYPARLAPVEYPEDWEVRRVRGSGQMKWAGHDVRVTAALTGEPVGLEPREDGMYGLYYSTLCIGVFDARRLTLVSPEAYARCQARGARKGKPGDGETDACL